MKSLIILVLLVALGAAAAFTRPSEASFKYYYQRQVQPKQSEGVLGGILKSASADAYLKQATYQNYFFFANIQVDGQTHYTGAFSHWFKRGAAQTAK